MVIRNSLEKFKDVAVGTVKGVVNDPGGTAGRALEQAKGALAVGKSVAEQVIRTASDTISGHTRPDGSTPNTDQAEKHAEMKAEAAPDTPDLPQPTHDGAATPSDVARVVEKKSPTEKAAASKSGAGKKTPKTAATTPGAKLPAKKTAKKAAKKTPAKKATAKKTPSDPA